MKLMLLGAPGSGKGTQSERLTKYYNIPQISTGDLLRANIAQGTALGVQVKQIIDRGDLVGDDIILALVRDRLSKPDCQNGYILDGFPRTIEQAEALSTIDTLDKVINLVVDGEVIMKRITGRRVCKQCGKITHISQIGQGNCPCGGEVFTRADDNEQTVRNRLDVYEKVTKPLCEYYGKLGILVDVDSDKHPDKVFEEIVDNLK